MMIPSSQNILIVERNIEHISNGSAETLIIRIYKPVQTEKSPEEWCCNAYVGSKLISSYGADSYQALFLIERMIDGYLVHLKQTNKLKQ